MSTPPTTRVDTEQLEAAIRQLEQIKQFLEQNCLGALPAVQKALDNGQLMVVDRSGHLAASDDVARGQHGMADPTPANGVIDTPKGDASANGS